MIGIAGGAVVEFSAEIDNLQDWYPFCFGGNGRSRRFDHHADAFPARLQDGPGGMASAPLQRMQIKKDQFENDQPEPGRAAVGRTGATRRRRYTFRLPEAGHDSFPFCNALLVKLCANLRGPHAETLGDGTMKMIDHECDNSVKFSELYMHLLNAAIGEMNSPAWSQTREGNWGEHASRGISMSRFSVGNVAVRD